jgi:Asp-tRNA(Asn)/Glu-tRNA(Gln) amidotransferase A subunit family amidase
MLAFLNIRSELTQWYKPEEVEGAPGHIQIMGKAMRDEELMEVMKAVEDLLRSNA